MRAIVRFRLEPDADSLKAILEALSWIPKGREEDHEAHRQDILNDVAINRALVESTYLYTVLDAETETWGIVSNPAGSWIEVRLKNAESEQLRRAATRLVADLGTTSRSGLRSRHTVHFYDRIEVLAPGSADFAFLGTILDGSPWQATRRERRTEVVFAVAGAVIGVTLLLLTSPFGPWSPSTDPLGIWVEGNLERLTSAALFSAIVSGLTVGLRYLEVRRSPVVNWN